MEKKINYIVRILTISIIIGILIKYCKDDYIYSPNYEVLEDSDAYAKYSNGFIYISDELNTNMNENDIFIYDGRYGDDPNVIIFDSYKIDDKEIRNEVLEVLLEYEKDNPSPWNRSIESMRLEWLIHNISYDFEYKIEDSIDVDINNLDEKKYKKKILNKLFKI